MARWLPFTRFAKRDISALSCPSTKKHSSAPFLAVASWNRLCDRPAYVAVDEAWVYFGALSDDADTARVQRVSRDGGAPETLWTYTETAVSPPGVTLSGIEVTGDVVVFLWGWDGRGVTAVPKVGGEPWSLGVIDAEPTDLAVAGGSAFATDHGLGAAYLDCRVRLR